MDFSPIPPVGKRLGRPANAWVTLSLVTLVFLAANLAAADHANAAEIPLHKYLRMASQCVVSELVVAPARLYVGQELTISARVSDEATGSPLRGADIPLTGFRMGSGEPDYSKDFVEAFRMRWWGEDQKSFTPEQMNAWLYISVWLESDAQGRLTGSLTVPAVYPGKYSLEFGAPKYEVDGKVYGLTGPTGYVRICDKLAIDLRAYATPDKTMEVRGNIATVHGVPLTAPVDILLDGKPVKQLQAEPNGDFAWSSAELAEEPHKVEAVFATDGCFDGARAEVLYDPRVYSWRVAVTALRPEVVLPARDLDVLVYVRGNTWPPPEPLALNLSFVGTQEEATAAASIEILSEVTPVTLMAPVRPGSYLVTAAPVPGPHQLAESRSLRFSVLAPTAVSVKTQDSGGLAGQVTSLGRALPSAPWRLLRGSQSIAEGLTDEAGAFAVPGPLDDGVYRVSIEPDKASFLLPCASEPIRMGSAGLVGAGVAVVFLVIAVLLGGAGALAYRAAQLRAVAARTAALAAAGAAPGETGNRAEPEVDPLTLPVREQIVYIYESVAVPGLSASVPRDPTRSPGDYLRAVAERLPQARQAFEALTRLYQEARFSLHSVSSEQAETAWALSRGLAEMVPAVGPAGGGGA